MTNAEVLRAVTETPAAACHLGASKGRIAKGFDADLVALDGDPLDGRHGGPWRLQHGTAPPATPPREPQLPVV